MDHAEKLDSGKNKNSQKQKAGTASRSALGVCQYNKKNKRCAGSTTGQAEQRTPDNVTDAFLKCLFLPKMVETEVTQEAKANKKLERDFNRSLSKLKDHYHIVQDDFSSLGYPYNIAVTLAMLKKNAVHLENLTIEKQDKRYSLVNVEKLSQNNVLYYIPVLPLYRWLKDKERKKGAILILSVFSYLYQNARIPFYRDNDSFLYEEYEMLQEWLMMDDDENHPNRLGEFKKAEIIGDIIGQKMYNLKNLDFFKQRLDRFKCFNAWDKKVRSIASEVLMMYEKYPTATIFKNTDITSVFEDERDEDFPNTMYVENYVSFCADGEGWLFDTLFQCVNDQFQEYSRIEEPTVKNVFDNKNQCIDLHFEIRLYRVLEHLTNLLFN